jgi:hypothetical protein
MTRTITRSLVAAATLGAAIALAPTPAFADHGTPSDENGWTQTQDFGSSYLCQMAGLAGQFGGRWLPGQWRCDGPVLWLRNEPLVQPES